MLRLGPVAPTALGAFSRGAPIKGATPREIRGSSLAKILLYPRHWWRRLPNNSVAVRHARRPS